MKKCIQVKSNEQFQCCVMNQIEVDVWFQEEYELTARIIEFNSEVIKFSGGYFIRENIEIYVHGNLFRVLNKI
ncbi:hypothetical protein GCM10010918_44160 [Paenibacillus radicis (ex Gao et al. 2016)]|uniref:Uncharacterized protein n=1 Tax=Paenibacillus radicis (ex Gao et al. 2016) TaxID=1737354 RepID=A0A917HKE4_9BACL|nr:hypothetical protein GCM10010918_44160 [Paenibacillus radicis (ex Gao et al. 2016)]